MDVVIVKEPSSKIIRRKIISLIKALYVLIIAILLYLPIFFMVILSFNQALTGNQFTGFTFKWYLEMFSNKTLLTAIINTLSIAVISTIISTIFGTLSAIGINSLNKRRRKSMILLNNVPILNADIVTGVFLFIIFQTIGIYVFRNPFPLGYITLLLAHIFFSTPYVVLSVLPKLNEMDNNLYDAAVDLGCNPRGALLKVIIPSLAGEIFAGAMLAFTMSIDDFTISYFVSGAEVKNLSIWIYTTSGNTRFGNVQRAYAFYTILAFVMFVCLITYNVIRLRKNNNQKRISNNIVKKGNFAQ